MINLRYHIVSITAVFLALGIGIAMGSSFLSDAAVQQVDRNIESTKEEARAAREENAELKAEIERRDERDEGFRDEGIVRLYEDRLEDVPVVVITVGGVDRDSLDRMRTALSSSSADFEGTLTLTDAVEVTGEDAEALGLEDATDAEVRAELIVALADELLAAAEPADPAEEPAGTTTTTAPATPPTTAPATTAPGTPSTAPPTTVPEEEPFSPDLIRTLVSIGVLDYEPADGGAPIDSAFEAPGHRYVIVTGPSPDIPDEDFVHPLLRALTDDGPAPVVVASAATGDSAEEVRELAIAPILADDVVASRVTTVDSAETLSGISAVILGLDDLGRDRRGHYGFGDSADSQLPPP